jgi:hypothetical protein
MKIMNISVKSPPPLLTKIKESERIFLTDGNILDIEDNSTFYSFVIKNGKVVGILKEIDENHLEILHKYKIPYK